MQPSRREFLGVPGAAVLVAGAPGVPWHQKIRRVGQVNMTERDPVELNVEEWANYWASLKVDAVLAWIPTQGPPANRMDPDTGASIRNCGQNLLCFVIDSRTD